MRSNFIPLLIILFTGMTLNAQVKIGENPQSIHPSSVLELESTDKVLVITRVTTAQMNAIVPSQGALCFNTDLQSVHYYNGTQWVNIGGGTGTGGPLTAEAIVNSQPTIVITPTATGDNLEVAPNSIRSEQIVDGGVNGVDIQDGSIGPGKLQDFSVTQDKLSENSVGAFALDNDNFGVSAFNNDAGYITAGEVNIVSGDTGNVLESRADGVFYNDQPLNTAINQNTDAIALDDDQSSANEIQNLELNGTLLGLSDTDGTVDLSSLTGVGSLTDGSILVGGASDVAQQLVVSGDATLANTGILTITENAITAEKLDRMGATDGQILVWEDDETNPDAEVGAWTPSEPSTHTGTGMSLFYADATTGLPTTAFNPNGGGTITSAPSLIWDQSKRINSGVLGIGIDGGPLSDMAKVHIMEGSPSPLDFPLQIQKQSGTNGGVAAGILFAVEAAGSFGKGSLAFERKSAWGVGDFHFLQNDSQDETTPVLANKSFSIKSNKDIVLYKGIEINGIGTGTAGQVLASGGTGNPVQWVNNGGAFDATAISGAGTTVSPYTIATDAITTARILNNNVTTAKIEPSTTDGQVLTTTGGATVWSNPVPGVFDTNAISGAGTTASPYTIATDAITTARILNNNVTTAKIQAATPTPSTDQMLITDTSGNVTWKDASTGSIPTGPTGSIFFSDGSGGLVEDAVQISFDDTGNSLNLGGGFASNQQKLNVNGNTRATAFLGAVSGENPAFRFFNDADTGMYSKGIDQLTLKAGNQDVFTIRETSGNGNEITANGALELEEELIDFNGNAGDAGQILSSTGTGVEWISPKLIATGKANGGSSIVSNGGIPGGTAGNYTVTFTNNAPNSNYIIQLTVQGNYRIYVSDQRVDGFDVVIIDNMTNMPTTSATEWFYTATNL